jgi:hypothetical protein
MGPEIVWLLRNVWPKDTPNLTGTSLASVDDDEARRLVNAVEDVKREFERYLAEDVAPHISRSPTRVGVVESVRLFTSEHSMNTDYLMMISGVLSGNGGVVEMVERRYTIAAVEELGRFSEMPGLDLSASAG